MRVSRKTSFEKVRGVNEVRIEADVAHLVVQLPDAKRTPDKHLDIYREMAAAGYPLRLIKMHPGGVSFAVERPDLAGATEILTRLGYAFEPADEMVILAIVAVNMREMWGVMAKMAETLLDADVDIYQVGDAHDAVLCMVPKQQVRIALRCLRKAFELKRRRSVNGNSTPSAS
jgi:aspartokinase